MNEVKLSTVFELGGHLMDETLKYYLMRIRNNWVTFFLDPYFLPLIILTNRYRVCDPPFVSSTLCHCVADRCRL